MPYLSVVSVVVDALHPSFLPSDGCGCPLIAFQSIPLIAFYPPLVGRIHSIGWLIGWKDRLGSIDCDGWLAAWTGGQRPSWPRLLTLWKGRADLLWNYKGDPYYIRNILIVLPPISSQVKVEPLEYNTPGSYIYINAVIRVPLDNKTWDLSIAGSRFNRSINDLDLLQTLFIGYHIYNRRALNL